MNIIIRRMTSKLAIKDFLSSCKQFSTATAPQEDQISIKDWNINYLKVGSGSKAVLLVPGGIGSIWTDYRPQVEGFDREQFTIVAYDPPGYGKSRPPERDLSGHFYEKEADVGYQLMEKLKVPRYSLVGWSAGSAASMIHAAKHPHVIDKLVLIAPHAYISAEALKCWLKFNNLDEWSEQFSRTFIDMYGKELMMHLWRTLMKSISQFYHTNNGDICKGVLKDIKCPTYIFYGGNDRISESSQVSYIKSNIRNCRVHLYENGKHNIHLRYAEDFNKRVQQFLLDM